jgi:excisionase family DNA binding protein
MNRIRRLTNGPAHGDRSRLEGHETEDLLRLVPKLVQTMEDVQHLLQGKQKSHLTVEEVGRLTGRAPYTVRQWIAHGRIDAIRVQGTGPRGKLLVPREQLRKLITCGCASEVPDCAID